MAGYIGRELGEKFDNPLIYQPPKAAAVSGVAARANGYDAALLIDLCQAILRAKDDGKLAAPRYAKMVAQAQIIVSAFAAGSFPSSGWALPRSLPSQSASHALRVG